MALIINGTCEEALSQESMTTTTWPLNNIEGEAVGSNPYPDPSTIGTTTNIDASLNELTSEPRGVAVFASSDDPYELTIHACGDLVGDPDAQPGWTVELTEQNDSGIKGIVVLDQIESDEVLVAVYVWEIAGKSTETSGSTVSVSDEELSGPGGIGNTREDVLGFWNIGAGENPVGEFTEDHFHYVTYDLPDYQLSFMFQLQNDDELRATDRAVDIIVSFISYASRSEADRMVNGWLPEDAEKVGTVEKNNIGEAIQRYHSAMIAGKILEIDYSGSDEPGGI